jgi:hypothetical protein
VVDGVEPTTEGAAGCREQPSAAAAMKEQRTTAGI